MDVLGESWVVIDCVLVVQSVQSVQMMFRFAGSR